MIINLWTLLIVEEPYKSLSKARKMFKEKVYKNKNLNHWDFMIRGS